MKKKKADCIRNVQQTGVNTVFFRRLHRQDTNVYRNTKDSPDLAPSDFHFWAPQG